MAAFDPIEPAPAKDTFAFDFTKEIGDSGIITNANWVCTVSPNSVGVDPAPQSRVLNTPISDNVKTSALCGNMVDGVIYILSATVTLSDGRVLIKSADVECSSLSLQPLPVPITAGTAQFNLDSWITRYPEFNGIDPELAQSLWNEASLFLRNDPSSSVDDLPSRTILLWMLMAHLATLYAGPGPATGIVGRINSKSVNGVSMSAEGFGASGTQAWYLTTRYGSDYWKATAGFRTMYYFPGPRRIFSPIWPFPPR